MVAGVALQWESHNNQRKAPAMKLNKDSTAVEINLSGKHSAAELDALISELGEIRAAMKPSVESKRPDPTSESGMNTPVTMEDEPAMMGARLRDGRIRLWARSAGFGWLAFNLATRDAQLLRDWMTANVQGDSDLIGKEDGQRH